MYDERIRLDRNSVLYIAMLRHSISRPFSTRFAIDNATIYQRCTGGARPLVAGARAPACPCVATPLLLLQGRRRAGDY